MPRPSKRFASGLKAGGSYADVKAEVERVYFLVGLRGAGALPYDRWCKSSRFVLLDDGGKHHTLHPRAHARSFLSGVRCLDRGTERPFLGLWLADSDIKRVRSIEFDPSGTEEGIFNTFHGLAAELLPAVAEDEVESLCAPVYSFIASLVPAQGDAGALCDWVSHLVQFPGRPSAVAPILCGLHGCGHRLFVEWVRLKLVGSEYSLTGARTPMDLLEKLLIHVDADDPSSHSAHLNLACRTLTDRAWRTVPNHLSVIYTTCSDGDRLQGPALSCSDVPCSPDLEALLADSTVQRAFYQSLLKRSEAKPRRVLRY